jgi:4-hydroxy-3-methylbut-2-enyl diphosphate reductase IspH
MSIAYCEDIRAKVRVTERKIVVEEFEVTFLRRHPGGDVTETRTLTPDEIKGRVCLSTEEAQRISRQLSEQLELPLPRAQRAVMDAQCGETQHLRYLLSEHGLGYLVDATPEIKWPERIFRYLFQQLGSQ